VFGVIGGAALTGHRFRSGPVQLRRADVVGPEGSGYAQPCRQVSASVGDGTTTGEGHLEDEFAAGTSRTAIRVV
jgi:hypothetical protein